MEGGGPISVLSLPFFPSLMKKIHNETPEKKEARLLGQVSLDNRPFILGYIAK